MEPLSRTELKLRDKGRAGKRVGLGGSEKSRCRGKGRKKKNVRGGKFVPSEAIFGSEKTVW